MSLKFRYASMLLGVFVLLGLGVYQALIFAQNQMYWQLIVLAIVLYGVMFLCGKKMTNVFIVLSMRSFIRKQGGVVDEEACLNFIKTSLPKKSEQQQLQIWEGIKEKLSKEGVIDVQKNKIVLIG